jgi:hypothetical protein
VLFHRERFNRLNEPVGKMTQRMQDREATAVLVTTSDGRLVGLLYREDTEHLAGVQTWNVPSETLDRMLQYNQLA